MAANNIASFVATTWQSHSNYLSMRIRLHVMSFEKVESLSAWRKR